MYLKDIIRKRGGEGMALINCPECHREISDKAEGCPHCGYPKEENSETKYNYNGVQYDISEVYYYLNQNKTIQAIKAFRELTNADLATSKNIVDSLKSKPNIIEANLAIRCPYCGSTNIREIKRGWRIITGFLGSGTKEKVCVNCKEKF